MFEADEYVSPLFARNLAKKIIDSNDRFATRFIMRINDKDLGKIYDDFSKVLNDFGIHTLEDACCLGIDNHCNLSPHDKLFKASDRYNVVSGNELKDLFENNDLEKIISEYVLETKLHDVEQYILDEYIYNFSVATKSRPYTLCSTKLLNSNTIKIIASLIDDSNCEEYEVANVLDDLECALFGATLDENID